MGLRVWLLLGLAVALALVLGLALVQAQTQTQTQAQAPCFSQGWTRGSGGCAWCARQCRLWAAMMLPWLGSWLRCRPALLQHKH